MTDNQKKTVKFLNMERVSETEEKPLCDAEKLERKSRSEMGQRCGCKTDTFEKNKEKKRTQQREYERFSKYTGSTFGLLPDLDDLSDLETEADYFEVNILRNFFDALDPLQNGAFMTRWADSLIFGTPLIEVCEWSERHLFREYQHYDVLYGVMCTYEVEDLNDLFSDINYGNVYYVHHVKEAFVREQLENLLPEERASLRVRLAEVNQNGVFFDDWYACVEPFFSKKWVIRMIASFYANRQTFEDRNYYLGCVIRPWRKNVPKNFPYASPEPIRSFVYNCYVSGNMEDAFKLRRCLLDSPSILDPPYMDSLFNILCLDMDFVDCFYHVRRQDALRVLNSEILNLAGAFGFPVKEILLLLGFLVASCMTFIGSLFNTPFGICIISPIIEEVFKFLGGPLMSLSFTFWEYSLFTSLYHAESGEWNYYFRIPALCMHLGTCLIYSHLPIEYSFVAAFLWHATFNFLIVIMYGSSQYAGSAMHGLRVEDVETMISMSNHMANFGQLLCHFNNGDKWGMLLWLYVTIPKDRIVTLFESTNGADAARYVSEFLEIERDDNEIEVVGAEWIHLAYERLRTGGFGVVRDSAIGRLFLKIYAIFLAVSLTDFLRLMPADFGRILGVVKEYLVNSVTLGRPFVMVVETLHHLATTILNMGKDGIWSVLFSDSEWDHVIHAQEILNFVNPNDDSEPYIQYCKEIVNEKEYFAKSLSSGNSQIPINIRTNLLNALKKAEANIITSANARTSRIRPVTVMFAGPPGTGKTELCKSLAEYINMICGHPKDAVFTFQPGSKFWGPAFQGFLTKFLIVNDVDSEKFRPNIEPYLLEFIGLADTAPYAVSRASLEEKLNSNFQGLGIAMSMNGNKLRFAEFLNNGVKIVRRIDAVWFVEYDIPYCESVGLRPTDQNFSLALVPDEYRDRACIISEGVCVAHEETGTLEFNKKPGGRVFISRKDFILTIFPTFHVEIQKRKTETEDLANLETCKGCMKISSHMSDVPNKTLFKKCGPKCHFEPFPHQSTEIDYSGDFDKIPIIPGISQKRVYDSLRRNRVKPFKVSFGRTFSRRECAVIFRNLIEKCPECNHLYSEHNVDDGYIMCGRGSKWLFPPVNPFRRCLGGKFMEEHTKLGPEVPYIKCCDNCFAANFEFNETPESDEWEPYIMEHLDHIHERNRDRHCFGYFAISKQEIDVNYQKIVDFHEKFYSEMDLPAGIEQQCIPLYCSRCLNCNQYVFNHEIEDECLVCSGNVEQRITKTNITDRIGIHSEIFLESAVVVSCMVSGYYAYAQKRVNDAVKQYVCKVKESCMNKVDKVIILLTAIVSTTLAMKLAYKATNYIFKEEPNKNDEKTIAEVRTFNIPDEKLQREYKREEFVLATDVIPGSGWKNDISKGFVSKSSLNTESTNLKKMRDSNTWYMMTPCGRARALLVEPNLLVLTHHTLLNEKREICDKICFSRDREGKVGRQECIFCPENYFTVGEIGFLYVKSLPYSGSGKLTDHFIVNSFTKNFVCDVDFNGYACPNAQTDVWTGDPNYPHMQGMTYNVLRYRAFTEKGDCGMAVMKTGSNPFLFGIHCLARAAEGEAACIYLSRSQILEAREHFSSRGLHEPATMTCAQVQRLAEVQELHDNSHLHLLGGMAYPIGTSEKVNFNEKPGVIQTPGFAYFSDIKPLFRASKEFSPPFYGRVKILDDGTYYSGFKKVIDAHNLPSVDPGILLDNSTKYFFNPEGFVWQLCQPLSFNIAYNGVPGHKYYRNVKEDTSAGPPWSSFGIHNKGELFEQETDFLPYYFLMEEDLAHSPIFLDVHLARKHEAISKEKSDRGEYRLFSVVDFVFNMIGKAYCLPIFVQMMERPDLFYLRPAMRCLTSEWDDMFNYLSFDKENMYRAIEIDFKAMDASQRKVFFETIAFEMGKVARKCGYSEREANIVVNVIISTIHLIVKFKGDVFLRFVGLASGLFCTVFINCFVQSILMIMIWTLSRVKEEDDFRTNVRSATVGDDGVYSVAPGYDFFNMNKLQEMGGIFGYVITSPKKDGKVCPDFVNLDTCTFLKRTFKFDKRFSKFVAPLDPDSIFKSLCWEQKDVKVPSMTRMIAVCQNAERELFIHGEEEFTLFCNFSKKYFADLNITYNCLQYDELFNEYSLNKFFTDDA